MKLIVGLGNPGRQYAGTRHNVGFDVVDALAGRHGMGMQAEKFHAWFAQGDLAGERVGLMKPTTFMNRSGQAVADAARFYKIEPTDLMVVVDDLALPVGRLRIRVGGSAGGHNGLQDIIDRTGSDAWCRMRLGIGSPLGNQVDFVLGRFDPDERKIMDRLIARSADAVECWLKDGPELAMTRYNGDVPPNE